MEFGWYVEFHRQVERQSDADAFAQGLDQVVEAERWGLNSVWLAEIHQQADDPCCRRRLRLRRRSPRAPTRLKIGTACRSCRCAIRCAWRGNRHHRPDQPWAAADGRRAQRQSSAYAAYGVPYSESRERFYETLDILKLAWTQPSFSYAGKFHSFDEARAVPRPYQQPHPPIRIAGASEDTFPALGALGYPLFVAVRSGSLSGLAPDLKAYRDAYKAAGHPGQWRGVSAPVAASRRYRRAGEEEAEPSMMQGYKKLTTQLEGSPNARRRAELEDVRTITYDQVLRDKVVVGSPQRVADRLRQLQEELGIDGILAELNFGARIPPST